MTADELAALVAKATKVPLADLKKSFANIIRRKEWLDPDRLGNTSGTVEALHAGLRSLDREARRRVAAALVELAVADAKAAILVRTFTSNAIVPLELNRDVMLALVLLDSGLTPLDWLEKGDEKALAKLRERAIARYAELGSAWSLEIEVLGIGTGEKELVLAERLFTLLALPCASDEEGIRLALGATGPGSQGYELLLACARWLRKRHGQPPPRILDPKQVWDGGAKEKAQGTYELLVATLHATPSLVPDMAVKLFEQAWAPKRAPGLWLAFAAHLEDRVSKGEGRYLSASARLGDVQLKYSRSKVKIEPPKTLKKKVTGKRSSR